jgi:hypothetical protein
MRLSGFGWVRSMNSPLRLCLCLVLVYLISIAATGSAAAASATGPLPKIERFTADPMVLEDNQAALYTFVVKGAENMRVIEGNDTLYEINSPSSATLKGTVQGNPTYAIRTGDSNTFDAIVKARNKSGEVEKKLTLSFASVLPPKPTSLIPPVSDILSATARTPKWGPQTSASVPSTPSTASPAYIPWRPEFAECPKGCNYCLKPDDAASRGFTQRCLEQPCYYSPDNKENWYCYSEPEGWCCKEGVAGQAGQVTEATKTQCAQSGGDHWSTNQSEAIQACQPAGWCCRGGQIAQATKDQCAQWGGDYWSTNQSEAIRACQPPCWCCAGGKVGQIPQNQCAQMGGACYADQHQAIERCQPADVPCWCCAGGKVGQTTQAQCAQMGGRCYADQHQAIERCQPAPVTYWCCRGGKVYPSTTPGAGCYATQAQAIRACQQPAPTYPDLK